MNLTITEDIEDEVDFVFSALGHKDSAPRLLEYIEAGTPVCDLSADFRLHDAAEYTEWYQVEHPRPPLLDSTIYGLPELHKDEIPGAKLVGNPGCYPTGAVLALAPAVQEGLIAGDIVVDGKSGVSGAGRSLSLTTHFSEVNESVRAYALDGHRHYPEIVQELERLSPGRALSITFMPHLIPMTRGILSTCYAPLAKSAGNGTKGEIIELYRDFYRGRTVRPGRRGAAADEADLGQQRLPGLPHGGPADGPADRGERHRQPGQGRGGRSGAEHEPDDGLPRNGWVGAGRALPLGPEGLIEGAVERRLEWKPRVFRPHRLED